MSDRPGWRRPYRPPDPRALLPECAPILAARVAGRGPRPGGGARRPPGAAAAGLTQLEPGDLGQGVGRLQAHGAVVVEEACQGARGAPRGVGHRVARQAAVVDDPAELAADRA